jgi:hypothetical protein
MTRLPSQLTYNDLNGAEAVSILSDWLSQLLRAHPMMQPHLTLPMAVFTLDVKVSVDMHTGGSVPVASAPEHIEITGRTSLYNEVARASEELNMETLLRLDQAAAAAEAESMRMCEMRTIVNAAPVPGGKPPDEIRTMHGLPIPGPGYGPRETGSHMFLADVLTGAPAVKTKPAPPQSSQIPVVPELHPAGPEASTAKAGDASISTGTSTGGRSGDVAPGYTFSPQEVTPDRPAASLRQNIPVDRGGIEVELAGQGIMHDSGMRVRERDHRASISEAGDEKGAPYGSVNGVYDPGPRGLMTSRMRGREGYGTDGRPRISFGNTHGGR